MTLWKPVPELISILGVEVPDSPEVSLAGIAAENITLRWTRPGANKPVVKYLIQVNGVNGMYTYGQAEFLADGTQWGSLRDWKQPLLLLGLSRAIFTT